MSEEHRYISSTVFEKNTLKELGMGLYGLRHDKGVSLENFAHMLGESAEAIEKIELGIYSPEEDVDFDLVLKIVRYFNAKIEMTIFS